MKARALLLFRRFRPPPGGRAAISTGVESAALLGPDATSPGEMCIQMHPAPGRRLLEYCCRWRRWRQLYVRIP